MSQHSTLETDSRILLVPGPHPPEVSALTGFNQPFAVQECGSAVAGTTKLALNKYVFNYPKHPLDSYMRHR